MFLMIYFILLITFAPLFMALCRAAGDADQYEAEYYKRFPAEQKKEHDV